MINFFKKHVELLLVLGVLFTIISPWLFTRSFGFIDFRGSGEIGSTIGGITAPITSLIGALLIYYALVAQRHANKIQSENNTVQTLLTLILDLENKCDKLVFIDENLNHRVGIASFNSFGSILYFASIKPYLGVNVSRVNNDLMSVVNFANYYNVIANSNLIFDTLESSDINKTNKSILYKRFEQIYTVYLSKSLLRLDEYYKTDIQKEKVKYDKYFEEIVEFNRKMLS